MWRAASVGEAHHQHGADREVGGRRSTLAPLEARPSGGEVEARGPDDDVDAGGPRTRARWRTAWSGWVKSTTTSASSSTSASVVSSARVGAAGQLEVVGALAPRGTPSPPCARRRRRPRRRRGSCAAASAAARPARAPRGSVLGSGPIARGRQSARAPAARAPARAASSTRDRVDALDQLVDAEQRARR